MSRITLLTECHTLYIVLACLPQAGYNTLKIKWYKVRYTELEISNIERRTPNVELKHPITRMPYLVLACLPQAGYNILDT